MRIQFCIASLRVGGAERRCALLANEVARRGHEVELVTAFGPGPLAERLIDDVRLVCLDQPLPFRRGGVAKLWRAIGRFRPDVFHGFSNVGSYYGVVLARLRGTPAVVASLGMLASVMAYSRAERLFGRVCLRFAHRITFNSTGVMDSFAAECGLGPPRVVMIPSFIPAADWLWQDPVQRLEVRRELGVADHETAVVTVARLVDFKDHQSILAAAARLAPQHPRLRLVFVGDGPEEESLRAQTEQLGLGGRVLFLGMRKDIPRLLQGMDLFCLPSWFEGMSNALLEAMAAGLPVVASRVAGSEDLVVPGRNGWLIEPKQTAQLEAALGEALEQAERLPAMGAESRRLIESTYDQPIVVQRLLELYESLLHRPRAAAQSVS